MTNEQWDRVNNLVDQMAKTTPPPEKSLDQMGWVQHMNMLHERAIEIILDEDKQRRIAAAQALFGILPKDTDLTR